MDWTSPKVAPMDEKIKNREDGFSRLLAEDHIEPKPPSQLDIHPAWIEIDTQQFQKNLAAVRLLSQGALLCLPVKANAYGHGLIPMAKIARQVGVDYLGVSCLQEALELKQANILGPILIFGAIHDLQIPSLLKEGFEFCVSSLYKAKLVVDVAKQLNLTCSIHVKVDTGMQRVGVRPDSFPHLASYLEKSPWVNIRGVYSHLATADEPQDPQTLSQIEQFQRLFERYRDRPWIWHLANSGGALHYPSSHFDMVRPGLLCYGVYPSPLHKGECFVEPCFTLKARVSYFKVVFPHQGVSYGHRYYTKAQTRIVTVPIGYGDGYRRCLYRQAEVLIRGKRYPIAGVICMDQFMVDVGQDEVYVGDGVVLIGRQKNEYISVEEIAMKGDSIPHEIFSAFTARLPRKYL